MSNERFWSLIDKARNGSEASASPLKLREVLRALDDNEILDFGHAFHERLCDLNKWQLWGAGYVIAGGMSDDGFHYFRSWIVGKGRQVFEIAQNTPDNLGPFIDDREVDNELLEYVPSELLEDRGIEEDPRDRSERRSDADPKGDPFDEDTVDSAFPKLTASFS